MINIKKIIVIGDRILIRPEEQTKTVGGLYLPPGVAERDKVQSGYVVKVGPGYPVAPTTDEDESWKEQKKSVKYVPLQVKEGDFAVFLKKESVEIEVEKEKLLIVSQSAILIVYRDDILLEF